MFRNRNQNQNENRQQDQQEEQQPVVSRTRSRSRQQETDMRSQRGQSRGQGGGNADMESGGQQQAGNQGGGRQQEGPAAWEEFLDKLEPVLQQAGDSIRVLDRAGWVKVENPTTGHKLYFNKGVTGVTRVESSLAPDAVKGAQQPEFYNGRITSIIPPTVEAVSEAIKVIAQVQERLSAPRRRTRDLG